MSPTTSTINPRPATGHELPTAAPSLTTAALTPPRATGRDVTRRARALRALAADAGQGTVEYVGLILLMATVLAGVVVAAESLGGKDKIGEKVVTQIGKSIDKAGGSGGK